MNASDAIGEALSIDGRIVVAPAAGRFAETTIEVGTPLAAGHTIGYLVGPGVRVCVESPFGGRVGRLLCRVGDRVSVGQPLLWLVKEPTS